MISYYGYLAEEHYVITDRGYNLTIFRCNSKTLSLGRKKVAIFFHGFLSSSDDITMNMPGQGLGCKSHIWLNITIPKSQSGCKCTSRSKCFNKYLHFHFRFRKNARSAYVLADAGYDVWLPNNRGNFYSRKNLFMDPNDTASGFWDFSWDDIAFEGS